MLVLTLVVALLLYWRARPGAIAHRFVAALNDHDYAAADECFERRSDRFAAELFDDATSASFAAQIDQTPSEWLRGRAHLRVWCSVDGSARRLEMCTVVVTAHGLQAPQLTLSQIMPLEEYDMRLPSQRWQNSRTLRDRQTLLGL